MKKETLHVYIRVSTEKQLELSPEAQKKAGQQKAKQLNMDYEIHDEGGASARFEDLRNRPVLRALMEKVESGIIKNIFVYEETRLSRHRSVRALLLNRFEKFKVNLFMKNEQYDFNNPNDSLMFSFKQLMGEYDAMIRKERFWYGSVEAQRLGRYIKPVAPYGYYKDKDGFLQIEPTEKKILLEMVDLYLNKGFGTNQIADWLNENNIPTRTSKLYKKGYTLKAGIRNRKKDKHVEKSIWNPGTVNSIFKNPIYTGERKFKVKDGEYETVKCPAIFSNEVYEQLQTKREQNAITKHKEDKYFYLLKNLLVCGNCGSNMHGRVKPNRGETTYRCNSKRDRKSSCKSVGLNIDRLNDLVWNSFMLSPHYHKFIQEDIEELKRKDNAGGNIKEYEMELKNYQQEKKSIDTKIEKLVKQSMDSRIPPSVYNKLLDEYSREQETVDSNISVLQNHIKRLASKIKEKEQNQEQQGLNYFIESNKDLAKIYPCKTEQQKQEAREFLNMVVDLITVTWNEKDFTHDVNIKFKKVGNKEVKPSITTLHKNDKDLPVKRTHLPLIDYILLEHNKEYKDLQEILFEHHKEQVKSKKPGKAKKPKKDNNTSGGGQSNSTPHLSKSKSLMV